MDKTSMSLEAAFYDLIQRHASAILLEQHDQLICLSSQASQYLRYKEGVPSLNILTLLLKPAQSVLSVALWQARQNEQPVFAEPITDSPSGSGNGLLLEVRPVKHKEFENGCMLIFFHDIPAFRQSTLVETFTDSTAVVTSLQQELNQSRNELENLIREHDESLGNLAASNEELHTINEELRCAS